MHLYLVDDGPDLGIREQIVQMMAVEVAHADGFHCTQPHVVLHYPQRTVTNQLHPQVAHLDIGRLALVHYDALAP